MFLASIKSIVRELILFFEVSADTLKKKKNQSICFTTQNLPKY